MEKGVLRSSFNPPQKKGLGSCKRNPLFFFHPHFVQLLFSALQRFPLTLLSCFKICIKTDCEQPVARKNRSSPLLSFQLYPLRKKKNLEGNGKQKGNCTEREREKSETTPSQGSKVGKACMSEEKTVGKDVPFKTEESPRSTSKEKSQKAGLVTVSEGISNILRWMGVRNGYHVVLQTFGDPNRARNETRFARSGIGLVGEKGMMGREILDLGSGSDFRAGYQPPPRNQPNAEDGNSFQIVPLFEVDSIRVGDVLVFNSSSGEFLLVDHLGDEGMVRGRILISAALRSFLAESALPNELFLTSDTFLGRLSTEEGSQGLQKLAKGTFRLRFFYDPTRPSIVTLSQYLCQREEEKVPKEEKSIAFLPATEEHAKGFSCSSARGVVQYHLNDFLYLLPEGKNLPFHIFQLVDLESDGGGGVASIKLRRFERQADKIVNPYGNPTPRNLSKLPFKDELRLLPTKRFLNLDSLKICRLSIRGKCFVRILTPHPPPLDQATTIHFEDFSRRDEFFVHPEDLDRSATSLSGSKALKLCEFCWDQKRQSKDLFNLCRRDRLSCLDMFCGSGGLSLGLAFSDVVKTRWAVDSDLEALQTFGYHHPSTELFHSDVSSLLERFLRGGDDQDGGLPRRGEVDILVGGPPCQGFSGLNKNSSRGHRGNESKDSRNLLCANMLSWVELLRPSFFLFENVTGLLDSKVGDHEKGYLKLITLSLLSLGYSTTFGVVQSGSFGVPQSRRRLILWGAKDGYRLPELPSPTHVFRGQPASTPSWLDGLGNRCRASHDTTSGNNGSAPLPPVTIGDAISDLPQFDWQDPHVIYPQVTDPELAERRKRQEIYGIPSYRVERSLGAVGPFEQPYLTEPKTSFQRMVRISNPSTVLQHQTRCLNEEAVERVVNVPLIPNANWESWSTDRVSKPHLCPYGLSSTSSISESMAYYVDSFRRPSYDSHHCVAVTSLDPSSKSGSVLHPAQARILTVREHARAQGFPDAVVFRTSGPKGLRDAHRQIGNAVPVPLATQLGFSLVDALVANHIVEQQRQVESRRAGKRRRGDDGKGRDPPSRPESDLIVLQHQPPPPKTEHFGDHDLPISISSDEDEHLCA
ncbi:S-adenosyl-L-methionine-dependent methyltransferase [Violaceomyces palustris]|uniref:S-adenosyl-L-methionine-dependent methyltransferase n=1 Tax=Violaceomyces palustris TaxID=1673888 RepID=A0ACD0NP37_9BASI|nr:S-adenosyl-L-methionine-dependent methyltransferase [Violaceomyces palustris]